MDRGRGIVIRIRIALTLVVIGASMWAAVGLFTSLRDFGIGTAIAALAICMQGLVTYVHDHEILAERDRVWARRDAR